MHIFNEGSENQTRSCPDCLFYDGQSSLYYEVYHYLYAAWWLRNIVNIATYLLVLSQRVSPPRGEQPSYLTTVGSLRA